MIVNSLLLLIVNPELASQLEMGTLRAFFEHEVIVEYGMVRVMSVGLRSECA